MILERQAAIHWNEFQMKILDTNVLIDLDRYPEKFSSSISRLIGEQALYISSVSVFEFWWGVYLTSLRKTIKSIDTSEFNEFISAFIIVGVDQIIAIEAASIGVDLRSLGKTIDLHDLYIAATAKILSIPLVTSNIKHFKDVEGINIVQWPY